jgi:hypothetical protein
VSLQLEPLKPATSVTLSSSNIDRIREEPKESAIKVQSVQHEKETKALYEGHSMKNLTGIEGL